MSRKPQECRPTKDCGNNDYGNHGKYCPPPDDKCDTHHAALISADADVDIFNHSIEVSADVLDCHSLLDVDVEIGHDSCYA